MLSPKAELDRGIGDEVFVRDVPAGRHHACRHRIPPPKATLEIAGGGLPGFQGIHHSHQEVEQHAVHGHRRIIEGRVVPRLSVLFDPWGGSRRNGAPEYGQLIGV